MRKYSLMLLVALLAIALGLGAVACGSGGKTASGQTPQEALTAGLDSLQTSASQSGTYDIAVTIDADSSQGDPMTQALFGQPINITGDFAGQDDPVRADISLGLDLMGFNVTAGVRAIDDNAWLNVLGQWYEVPAEDLQTSGDMNPADLQAALQKALADQGIDPNIWLTDLKVVGQETLGDTAVTHMSSAIDVSKMFTDVFTLLQDPELLTLLGDADALGADAGVSLPDASETQEVQDMLEQMIEDATLELWLADSDNSPRKIVMTLDMTLPQDLGDTGGINGLNVVMTINFDAPGTAVEVSAPASSKPLSELETDLQSNPLLSGFGSLLGSGSGLDGLLGQ